MPKSKKAIVVYFSRDGNTRKVAKIIAEYLKCKCVFILEAENISIYDLIVIGSPVYTLEPVSTVTEWIKSHDFTNKKVVLLCTYTWFGEQRSIKIMKKLVQRQNGNVIGFHVTVAKHKFFKPDRPNSEDLNKVKDFAKNVLKMWKKS